jgi:hypothetical protein
VSRRRLALAALSLLTANTFPALAQSAGAISTQNLAAPGNANPNRILGGAPGAAMPKVAVPPPTQFIVPGTAASADWTPQTTADLIILDKIYGTTSRVSAEIGKPFTVRSLQITVLACATRPPAAPPDAAVFLQVVDTRLAAGTPPTFRGWILRAEPGISALNDPVTDIAIAGCR